MTCASIDTTAGGELRKLDAFAKLEGARRGLIREARRMLLAVLLQSRDCTCTMDDVRVRVELPEGVNPTAFGPVPGALAGAGIIAPVGYVKSTRREAHARPVQVWRLVDRAAAVRWIFDNAATSKPTTLSPTAGDRPETRDTPGAAAPAQPERN